MANVHKPGKNAAVNVPPAFVGEASAWSAVAGGWRPLFGSFRELGFSFEWQDFTCSEDLDWARSFHPGSVEVCLNLDGEGLLSDGRQKTELHSRSYAFYFQGQPPLTATRGAGQRHRFITAEYSAEFLIQHLHTQVDNLHPLVRDVVLREAQTSRVTLVQPVTTSLLQLIGSLRHCPVFKPAQEMWFRSRATELAAHLFFSPSRGELFCTRAQRLANERAERAQLILKERLQSPPTLEELGRLVGCSPFYLSRLFSQATGVTIQQYLRQVRMERAAELLRAGKCNVTEAALEVGYSSLSHFSTTFLETFGCCPGLYPFKTSTQRVMGEAAAGRRPSSAAS